MIFSHLPHPGRCLQAGLLLWQLQWLPERHGRALVRPPAGAQQLGDARYRGHGGWGEDGHIHRWVTHPRIRMNRSWFEETVFQILPQERLNLSGIAGGTLAMVATPVLCGPTAGGRPRVSLCVSKCHWCLENVMSIILLWFPRMEEREKGWDLTSKLIFSASGLVNERGFLTQNISEYSEYMRNICFNSIHCILFCSNEEVLWEGCHWLWSGWW